MTHVTVTLDPAANGLLAHPDIPGPSFEFDAELTGNDHHDLEVVWGICNSSPAFRHDGVDYEAELFCDERFAPIVEEYRKLKFRSLSVGDKVTLANGAGERTYRVAPIGFEPVTD